MPHGAKFLYTMQDEGGREHACVAYAYWCVGLKAAYGLCQHVEDPAPYIIQCTMWAFIRS